MNADPRAGNGSENDTHHATSSGEVDPTDRTYGWTPEDSPCENCGERVSTRWRDSGQWVCEECKKW